MSFLASFPDSEKSFPYVGISPPTKKIILAGDHATKTSVPPSTCSSKTAYISQSRARHRALITDHGSAITGSIDATLQLIHLISEIRGANKDLAKAETAIESVEPNLHLSLDTYALFCLTIPFDQLRAAMFALALDNEDWAKRAKIDKNAKRELDLSKPPYHVTTIQVFVLHPSFQPKSMPLMILDPAARGRGSALCAASDWKPYFPEVRKTGGLVDSQGNALLLPWQTSRNDDEQLSLFALIVNSYSKLQSARKLSSLAPQFSMVHPLSLLWEDTKRMMELIFYEPPQVEAAGTRSMDVSQAESLASSSFSESLPSASSSFIRMPVLTMDSDGDSDNADDEIEDGYPCPDTQAPLTAAEVEIALSRASNGKLTGDERVESAMLLFGMAGNHLLLPDVDSA
ncbi:hypothetical protein BT96DRAFT_1012502 [Gymnopus androsaceus JB14]|uniref:Uncharacterized protein n=1 Tax=Gymnopus androsaceus JB14 TaxID=1447944 RepID=A0A6A4IHN9_9AGAR|nr:hypothetical protein BT96DRAFT_1012502 [Gymnopus androsaceus JB14]